jgi:hypothetical protein
MPGKPSPISGSFSLYEFALRIWKGTMEIGMASANSRASLDRAPEKGEIVGDLAPSCHRDAAKRSGSTNYDSKAAIKLAISLNLTDDQLATLLILTRHRRKAMLEHIEEELSYRRRQEFSFTVASDGSTNMRR